MTCTFPLCKQNEYKNGLCLNHNRIYGSTDVKKVAAPIPDKSAKRKELDKEYRKLVKEMLKEIILSAMIADGFWEEKNDSVRSRREVRNISNA